MSTQTKSVLTEIVIRGNNDDYPDIEDDEKKPISMDETQKKSNIPLAPVTFYFVGLRPAKLHKDLTKIHGVTAVKIKFDSLTLNDTVSKLKESICSEFGLSKTRSILIVYGNIKLVKDEEVLKNYGVTDNSCFLLAVYDNINTKHQDLHIDDEESSEIASSRLEREQQRRERDMNAVKRRLDRRNGNMPNAEAPKKKNIKMKDVQNVADIKRSLLGLNIQTVKALDIITQETNEHCMKMPVCGHPLSQNALYQFSLSQYKNRERMVCCPHTKYGNTLCQQPFNYPIIKQYLLAETVNNDKKDKDVENKDNLSAETVNNDKKDKDKDNVSAETVNNKHKDDKKQEDDIKTQESEDYNFGELELLAARNMIEIDYDLQKCAECKTLLYRNQKDNNFVVRTECPLCPSSVFCWGCNEKWSDDHICDTSFKAQTMEIISKCDTKTIGYVKSVPSIRCCPKCNQLIHHVSACKHMKCSFCKTDFCFVCLKTKEKSSWQCGGSSDRCPIHKRQNYSMLPKLNQTSFEVY